VLSHVASLLSVLLPVPASKEVLANVWKVSFEVNEEME
jgi:hypothetical protein